MLMNETGIPSPIFQMGRPGTHTYERGAPTRMLWPLREHKPGWEPALTSQSLYPVLSQAGKTWVCTSSDLIPRRNLSFQTWLRNQVMNSKKWYWGKRGKDTWILWQVSVPCPAPFFQNVGISIWHPKSWKWRSLFTFSASLFSLAWCWPQRGRPTALTQAAYWYLLRLHKGPGGYSVPSVDGIQ